MRAVVAVLRAAGNLKRQIENAEYSEDQLVYRAIQDVNLPKFLSQDIPLFNGIMQDLFPDVKLPAADNKLLLNAMREAMVARKLQPVPAFEAKALQLHEMVVVRHGVMLVGQSYGPKTSVYQVQQHLGPARAGTTARTRNQPSRNPAIHASGLLPTSQFPSHKRGAVSRLPYYTGLDCFYSGLLNQAVHCLYEHCDSQI
eukprot:3555281-Pyramimonas_sp.AAC.1